MPLSIHCHWLKRFPKCKIHSLGYDWLGWKKRVNTETLNLVFTFDTVRTFYRVDIHTNNHFSKDIQVRTLKSS
jgi:hypothetical protein